MVELGALVCVGAEVTLGAERESFLSGSVRPWHFTAAFNQA